MSTLKVDGIRSNSATSDAITLASDGTCTAQVTNNLSNRRMNINGAMLVWQRGNYVSVSDGSNEDYQSVDRYGFKFGNSSTGAATISQSGEVPTNLGFPNSYKIGVTTVNNNANNAQILFFYRFEAQDIVSSGWKYNDPNSFLTISFYFKSNKSGTNKLPVQIRTFDGTVYYYVAEITQSDTNWNRHTVKIPGNSNLTFNNDTGTGLEIAWYFAVGSTLQGSADTWGTTNIHGTSNSTNYFDSTSNDMWITGIQIEATTNGIATGFEHRSYADELRRCQRYYFKRTGGNGDQMCLGYAESADRFAFMVNYPVPMRANPSFTGSATSVRFYSNNPSDTFNMSQLVVFQQPTTPNPEQGALWREGTSGATAGQGGGLQTYDSSTSTMEFSAEI